MGDAKGSIPKLIEAQQQSPWHPQIASILGAAYFYVNDYPAAVKELQALIDRFEDFNDARRNLTEIYMAMGKYAEAAKTIDYWRIHAGDPENDNYYKRISGLLKQAEVPPRQ